MSRLQTAERPGTISVPTVVMSAVTAWMQTLEQRHRAIATGPRAPTPAPCRHDPQCPAADTVDHGAARVIAAHPEQGWSLLCNGVISFDDTGELLPDGRAIEPRRASARRWMAAGSR